jgi:hypothetical protein
MKFGPVLLSGSTATVPIVCQGSAGQRCVGTMVATVRERRRGVSVIAVRSSAPTTNGKTHIKTVTVTVGHTDFAFAAGSAVTDRIVLVLNSSGRRLLGRFGRVPADLTVSGTTTGSWSVAFTLVHIRVGTPADKWGYTPLPCGYCYTTADHVPISGLPAGAHLFLSCHGPGCPFSRLSITPRKKRVDLASWLHGGQLLPGAQVDLAVTAPRTIGELLVYRVRRGFVPLRSVVCLFPTADTPVSCASFS